jgi:photosystem II stability/assembly factor-like uncharacterized protein
MTGSALKRAFGAAVLGCGLVVSGAVAFAQAPAMPRGIPAETLQRLLLLDAARVGSRLVAVGDRGAIVLSDDDGKTWRAAQAPAAPLLTAVAFAGEALGLAVGHDSVILASRDQGATWSQVFSAPAEQRPLLDVLARDADHAFAIGAYGAFYETADGGRTWNARKIIPDDKHLNAIADAGHGHLVIVGEAGTILLSPDGGATWSPVASPYKGSFFGVVAAGDGALVAFGLRGRIFRSTDQGASWKPVDNASVAALMGGDRLPDGALVLAGAAGSALVSRDDGRSFVPITTGTTRAFSKALLGGPNEVLLLGEAGVRTVSVPSAPRRSP